MAKHFVCHILCIVSCEVKISFSNDDYYRSASFFCCFVVDFVDLWEPNFFFYIELYCRFSFYLTFHILLVYYTISIAGTGIRSSIFQLLLDSIDESSKRDQ